MDFGIVRARTAALIAEMTDPPGAAERPFARDFFVPRLATRKVIEALNNGPTFTVVEGAPVTGKTSLLRELALGTADSDHLAVLMLRGSGPGIFQALANQFAIALEWNITANDARQWLRRMSKGMEGPALVIAINNVGPGTTMAADLENWQACAQVTSCELSSRPISRRRYLNCLTVARKRR